MLVCSGLSIHLHIHLFIYVIFQRESRLHRGSKGTKRVVLSSLLWAVSVFPGSNCPSGVIAAFRLGSEGREAGKDPRDSKIPLLRNIP